jgi:8-oxo-dGTP pyrophosphatase MutT (NUDIX family)
VTFDDAVARLEAAFERELPGAPAQDRMSPIPRRQWPTGVNPARIRNAAGLLIVFPSAAGNAEHAEAGELAERFDSPRVPRVPRVRRAQRPSSEQAHIVLTVRADTLRRHGGQVSLPGGVVEPGETFEQAALREAQEEVALARDDVRVRGALTPLDIPVSGFRLHPIVATLDSRPSLAAVDGEVASILEIPIAELMNPSRLIHISRDRDGIAVRVPAFRVAEREIWGATAMVLAEFLTLLGWSGPILT